LLWEQYEARTYSAWYPMGLGWHTVNCKAFGGSLSCTERRGQVGSATDLYAEAPVSDLGRKRCSSDRFSRCHPHQYSQRELDVTRLMNRWRLECNPNFLVEGVLAVNAISGAGVKIKVWMTGQSCSYVTPFFITRVFITRVLTRTRLSRCSRTDCTRFVFQIRSRPFLPAADPEQVDAATLLRRELCSASSCFESRPGLQFRPSFRGFSQCLLANAMIVPGLWGGCFLRNSYQFSTYPADCDATGSFEILTNLSTYPTDYDAVAFFEILTNLYILLIMMRPLSSKFLSIYLRILLIMMRPLPSKLLPIYLRILLIMTRPLLSKFLRVYEGVLISP